MGFIFIDGFDHYTAMPGSAGAKWDNVSQVSKFSIDGSGGRFGGGALKCTGQASDVYISKNITTVVGTIYVGFAYKITTIPNNYFGLITLYDGTTAQCGLALQADGHLSTHRGVAGQGTKLTESTNTYSPNTWHFIDIKVVLDGTNGIFQVYVDGVEWIDDSYYNTKGSSTTNINAIRMFYYGAAINVDQWLDDLHIDNSVRQGDCRIITNMPSAAGNYTQWDASAGSNYQCVDESPPNTSDYVSTNVTDEIDTYVFPDIPQTAGTVKAVVGNYYVQKTDAGSRQIAMVTRLSSTDLVSSGQAVPSSWGFLQFIQETKPGGGAWGIQDTKDAELGVKLVA